MKRNEEPKTDKHIPMPPLVRRGVPGLVEKVSLRTAAGSRGEEEMDRGRVAEWGQLSRQPKRSKMNGEEMAG